MIKVDVTPVLCKEPEPVSTPPPRHYYEKMEPVRSLIKGIIKEIKLEEHDKRLRIKRRRAGSQNPHRFFSPMEKRRSRHRKRSIEAAKAEANPPDLS